jgi:hypothetical protein
MSLKIAVLYTGLLRTFNKTIPFFKQNIIDSNIQRGHQIHVHACLHDNQHPITHALLRNELGHNLMSLSWFDPEDQMFRLVQQTLLNNMNISEQWKHYLRTSGSMIEYYQLYLANLQMVKKEQQEHFHYDYVIRLRPDIVITKPITFDWLTLTKEQIQSRLSSYTIDSIGQFFYTLIDPNRSYGSCDTRDIHNIYNQSLQSIHNAEDLLQFIHHGRYILTLRKNVVYIVKRDLFHSIASIGITYGLTQQLDNDYWFNAESQLQSTCTNNDIVIFDSTTRLEDQSLYNFDTHNYFDHDGHLIDNNCLFFICRN